MTQLTHQRKSDPVGLLFFEHGRNRSRALVALAKDLMELAKIRITAMVVLTTLVGFVLGSRAPVAPILDALVWSWRQLAAAMIGTALSCMGAAALNQVYERKTDLKMNRTMDRPVPTGRISPLSAAVIGVSMAVTGVVVLAAWTHPIAAALSGVTILSYILIYTPLKGISSVSTIVGAVPGALPPVIGYMAARGSIGVEAMIVFAIMFIWQVPHFLAIAWLYREDFALAGFPILPVIDPRGTRTFVQIVLWCLVLAPLGTMPTVIGFAGRIYFIGALLSGLVFLGFGVALGIGQTRSLARSLFVVSLIYLPVVLILMLIDGS